MEDVADEGAGRASGASASSESGGCRCRPDGKGQRRASGGARQHCSERPTLQVGLARVDGVRAGHPVEEQQPGTMVNFVL
jgi:hypothetical protein